ncbi:MAG: hypothetical protein RPR97_16015 [Colwellia sp.]
MRKDIESVVDGLGNMQNVLKEIFQDMEKSKELFKLSELGYYVDRFCTDNSIKKSDVCQLANISSTTLTSTLKAPEKASMTTIISIGEVVGFEIFIGRKNV